MFRGCILGCCFLLIGCGAEQSAREAGRAAADEGLKQTGSAFPSLDGTTDGVEGANVAGIDRKIIYEAEVTLVVRDFSETEEAVPRLVREHGGYLAHVSIDRTSGEHRSGNWQARIPVAQFDSFLDALSRLGIPESRSQTAQDVTEEYVDIEARIANKRRLEKRILELLDNSDGKIKDVIKVERELARVRGEIEQMEGRLRYLANRTELTTVRIVALEQRDFVPSQAPAFLARTRQAWGNSLLSLRKVGEDMAVAVVSAFPWMLSISVFVAPTLWYARRRMIQSGTAVNKE